MQAIVNDQFNISSDYYVILKKDRDTDVFTDIGVRITSWYTPTSADLVIHDSIKKIIFKDLSEQILLGDIFEFEGYRWMVIITDNIASITQSCAVQRCNIQLKFIDSTADVMPATPVNTIYTVDGIADVKVYIPIENRYLLLPSDNMAIRIPNNATTRKIKDAPKGTRFLFGNPVRAWRTVAIDSITETYVNIDTDEVNGLISLKLQLDAINRSIDNVTVKLAKQYS